MHQSERSPGGRNEGWERSNIIESPDGRPSISFQQIIYGVVIYLYIAKDNFVDDLIIQTSKGVHLIDFY